MTLYPSTHTQAHHKQLITSSRHKHTLQKLHYFFSIISLILSQHTEFKPYTHTHTHARIHSQMDHTARLVTQWLLIIGFSVVALMSIFNFTNIAPASLCMSFPYSIPAIRSMCVEYVCYLWNLLSRQQYHSQGPLLTPRNLFLLINLIILFLFTSLHLQQRAATGKKRKTRTSRRQPTEILISDHQAMIQSLQGSSPPGLERESSAAAAAAMALAASPSSMGATGSSLYSTNAFMEISDYQSSLSLEHEGEGKEEGSSTPAAAGGRASMESLITAAARVQEGLADNSELPTPMVGVADDYTQSSSTSRSLVIHQGSRTADRAGKNGPDVEKIVLDEDGQLRLIEGSLASSKTTSQTSSIVDRESINGSDSEKIDMDEDGRLRWSDSRPMPSSPYSTSYPGDNYDGNDNDDSDNNKDDKNSVNDNYGNLSVRKYGGTDIEFGRENDKRQGELSANLRQGTVRQKEANPLKSSSGLRASAGARPRGVKKAESMDATWKMINDSRGSGLGGNGGRDHNKHVMINRQNSRHDFKPSISGRLVGGVKNVRRRGTVRREPSIGQEELNAKVESFIARFNEQIKIQRQQSLLSYMQMVDRGAS